jgi:hypothetical protein
MLGLLIRAAIVLYTGHAVSDEIMSDADIEKIALTVAPAVLAIGWSVRNAFKGRQKLVTAMGLSTPVSESQLTSMIASVPHQVPTVTTAKTDVPVCPPEPHDPNHPGHSPAA